jgi:16S rRNA processing protein RimM
MREGNVTAETASPPVTPSVTPNVTPNVTLAVIIGAHGIQGEVRVKLFCDTLANLKAHKSFNGGKLTPTALRPNKDGALARFAEVTDRNAAEKMRGMELTVPRAALPPLAEGEYYHVDLLGRPCVSTDGTALGECIAVDNFGATDVLEICKPDGKTFMVPMTPNAVPEWDAARIVIDAAFVE